MSWQGAIEIVGIIFALAMVGAWGIRSIVESAVHTRAVRRRLADIGRRAADDTAWGEVVQLHPEARSPHHGRSGKR